jgi:hypothetical protein
MGGSGLSKEPAFDPEAVIDAMTPLLGLAAAEDYRPGIAMNLRICAGFAALLDEVELGDHEEPAPVFTA